jgi:hypothetical protein
MKKLVLIHPYPEKHFGEENITVIVQMPLNLGYIAVMTPRDEWEIDFVDEVQEKALDDEGNLTFGHGSRWPHRPHLSGAASLRDRCRLPQGWHPDHRGRVSRHDCPP